MASFKAVVFDWDGTIVSTMSFKIQNAQKLFQEFKNLDPERTKASYLYYSGIPRRELFDKIFSDQGHPELSDVEFQDLSHRFTSMNLRSYESLRSYPKPELLYLEKLKSDGFKLFVSSSAVKNEIQELAERLEIDKIFIEILGSQDKFKKGPAHIEYLMSQYGFKNEEILFVGDELADIRLANLAKVSSVGITAHIEENAFLSEGAMGTISKLSDLESYLG